VLQIGTDLFHVLHEAVRLKIKLLQTPVELAVGHAQGNGLVVQPVCFFIRRSCVGLLHQVRGLLGIFFFLGFKLLELLADGIQILGLFLIALVAMTSHTATLPEKALAVIDGSPRYVATGQHYVRGMTALATRLCVLLRIKRPQPMLIISVRLLDAGSGATVSLMARRAAEFLRIMYLQ